MSRPRLANEFGSASCSAGGLDSSESVLSGSSYRSEAAATDNRPVFAFLADTNEERRGASERVVGMRKGGKGSTDGKR